MPTAIEVLFVLTLTCCLLLLFPYYVGIIVGCCSLIFLFCKRISEEKRHPESAPTSPTAPLDQSDARLVRETRNPDLERRREILTKVEDIRAESKRPSIPCAGKEAILTIENENTDTEKCLRHPKSTPAPESEESDTDYSEKRLNTSIELKKSKTTQPLPCSTKAKHLYPKCNSAAQACR